MTAGPDDTVGAAGAAGNGPAPRVIIAGFGLPGRSVADTLQARGISHVVIELNAAVVQRCERPSLEIIAGDARDPNVLIQAGVQRASMLVVAIPNDAVVLDVVKSARALNQSIVIVARCAFISAGLEAAKRGAQEVVVAEQIVANEMSRMMENFFRVPDPR